MSVISDHCEVKIGQSAPQDTSAFSDTGMPFVRAGSLEGLLAGESLDSLEHINEYNAQKYKMKIFPEGSSLFPKSGMSAKIGRVYKLPKPAFVVSHIAAVIPNEDIDQNYLFRWWEYRNPATLISNDAYPSIKKTQIEAVPFSPPLLPEQKRIAAILDQADALQQKRQQALDHLNQLGQSIFYEMFGDPIKNTKGLNVVKLADAGSLDRGISKHRPRNHPALLGGEHPLIQTGDVSNAGDYVRTYTKTYSEIGLRQSKKWPAGTLCITIAANIANTAILDFDACFPDSVVGFVPTDNFSSIFIHYWFKSVREDIERLAPAVAQKNINLQILRNLDLIAPSKAEQDIFAKRIREVENIKLQTLNAIESTKALFTSLQQGLFSGDIRC